MRAEPLKQQVYKTGGLRHRIFLCLALCALIVFGAVQLREKLGLPLGFSLQSPVEKSTKLTPSPAESALDECEITLSGRSWYALQLGAFTQENAAYQLSQEFIPRGAAGYVCHQGSIYRVYAAAYPTRSEAQSVQTRLSEQGVSTYIQPCGEEALTLRAAGTRKQLAVVRDIFSYLDTLSQKFFTLSSRLDKNEITAAEAFSALSSESSTCLALANTLSAAFDDHLPPAAQVLSDLLTMISLECESAQNSQSAARAGAALKRSHFAVIIGCNQLSDALK